MCFIVDIIITLQQTRLYISGNKRWQLVPFQGGPYDESGSKTLRSHMRYEERDAVRLDVLWWNGDGKIRSCNYIAHS